MLPGLSVISGTCHPLLAPTGHPIWGLCQACTEARKDLLRSGQDWQAASIREKELERVLVKSTGFKTK